MKKILLTLCVVSLTTLAIAQQQRYSPDPDRAPATNGDIAFAPAAACDNEKGYYDFPFTEEGITVTGSGTGTYQVYGPGWESCGILAGANCVWIGLSGPATFTNTFSEPVNNMIYNMTATDIGEVITITVNSGTPTITYSDGSCPSWFSIVGNTITCVDGVFPAAGGRFVITSTSDFTSVTFAHNGVANGTTMTMCFDQVFNPPPPPTEVPVANWALILGGIMIASFVFIRYRRMI